MLDTGAGPIDLLDPANVADPYPALARLRATEPVHWSDVHRTWLVTGYDLVVAGFREPRLSSDRIGPVVRSHLSDQLRDDLRLAYANLQAWMVFNDPPEHTRLRRLVTRAFTPRQVERLRPRIARIVDGLLEDLRHRERFDLILDFAFPIPAVVIAEMLGVPAADADLFKQWSDDIMAMVFADTSDPTRHQRARRGFDNLDGYFRNLIRECRLRPADNLMSGLVAGDPNGDGLTDDEIVAMGTLLLFGGHETTTNLIGNGLLALLRHPHQLDRLRREPALIEPAVEEFLRYDGPAKGSDRRVLEDLVFGGRQLRAGQRVTLMQAAANRDPSRFSAAEQLDIGRSDNRHVGFGFGLHYCVGAPLARLEGRIAIQKVVARVPALSLAGEPIWHRTLISRGMRSMPVATG